MPEEAWLRGPVPGVPAALQPIAHALVQASEEAQILAAQIPAGTLWARPAGVAAPGFHLQHMRGVVDRLFTYARGDSLTEAQRATLEAEGKPPEGGTDAVALAALLHQRIEEAIDELRGWDAGALDEARAVGRRKLPSTTLGLLYHAAEHVQRHLGQLIVTVRVLADPQQESPGS